MITTVEALARVIRASYDALPDEDDKPKTGRLLKATILVLDCFGDKALDATAMTFLVMAAHEPAMAGRMLEDFTMAAGSLQPFIEMTTAIRQIYEELGL